jgi:transcriptional regulator with XRE-family HTH domain
MVKSRLKRSLHCSEDWRTGEVPIDLHRNFVFPNRMREQRQLLGYPKLLRLSAIIPDIPYIRLSKIERGEVVPRPEELRRIAAALSIATAELLLDIDAPDFDIAHWAEPFGDGAAPDLAEERFAVLLAAAVRARRAGDPDLTIAGIEQRYGLPPVNLSRIENALKPFGRWNSATRQSLFALFGVAGEAELRAAVDVQHEAGALDSLLPAIANPRTRHDRTRTRIAEVAAALAAHTDLPVPPAAAPAAPAPAAAPVSALLPVLGAPLPGGLIADTVTDARVDPPRGAGPHAFALRVGRATLGAGLPAQAVVIADPDRVPAPGGIAALREEGGWRLLSVGIDRDGRLLGYSTNPALEIALDEADPATLAAVVAALYP